MAHSTEIANEFIRMARQDGRFLTQMQLQKLVYISHGWDLAINNRPLTFDHIQAWDYGPVYPELWRELKTFGSGNVTRNIMPPVIGQPLGPDDIRVINEVYDQYGEFPAFKLSELTHQQGTPWHQMYVVENYPGGNLDNNTIRNHFIELGNND